MNTTSQKQGILVRLLVCFHRQQSGAVALLSLAGALIIFMTALVMFDSGWASQEKMRVQTSADSAAFANAAVKARAMNSVAYMNVVKRSLTGMFEMYVGMMYFFRLELEDTLQCLAEVTEELEDHEEELEEYAEEEQEYTENCQKEKEEGDGDGKGKGGGKKEGTYDEGDCEDDGRKGRDKPRAPATQLCEGCERLEGSSPFEGMTFPTIFGFNMDSIMEAVVMVSSDQDCANQNIFDAEAYGDWLLFSGLDAYDLLPRPYGIYDDSFDAMVTKFVRLNLRSLTDFQNMLIMLAPTWAMAEAQQRGLFSTAKVVTPPEEPAQLPVEAGTDLDLCLSRQGHYDQNNKTGPALLFEIEGNIRAHEIRSHADSKFDKFGGKSQQGAEYMESPGCAAAKHSLQMANVGAISSFDNLMSALLAGNLSDLLFGGGIGDERGHMFPYHNTEDEIHDFYMTYRENKLTSGEARDKFGYMRQDYKNPDTKVPEIYEGMSCAEAINLNPEYRMWRSSWAARVAPVEKCDPELFLQWK